jgi:hypothetical protein
MAKKPPRSRARGRSAKKTDFWDRLGRLGRGFAIALAVILLVAVVVRLLLPGMLERYINGRLQAVPEYTGRVESVDVGLLRGAYALNGVTIRKQGVQHDEPFFTADRVDFSLAWRELLQGRVVSDVVIDRGRLVFVKEPAEEFSQLDADGRWQRPIEEIFPVDITYLEIRDGFLRYIDRSADPVVDVFVDEMSAVATGLRNRPEETDDKLPANLLLQGGTLGGGRLVLLCRADPLAQQPHFELRLTVHDVNLPDLNDLLRAYGNVDVSAGVLELYFEVAARDGRFEGYAKPFLAEVDFTDLHATDKNLAEKLWEKVVAGLVALFKNKPRDELATRMPFAGEFGNPEFGLLATLRTMLRHGFIEPLPARLEQSVRTENVEPPGETPKPPPEPRLQ